MNEDFIYYLWKYKLLYRDQLKTIDGKDIELIHAGHFNAHSGPDFFAAKVRIGDTLWVGNVEIHVRTSDWKRHHHERDKAYDNVILHVVFEHDMELKRQDGSIIPALEIKGKFDEQLWLHYKHLINNRTWIPCEKQLPSVDPLIIESWLNRLAIGRLEHKSEVILERLRQNKFNWDETFYQFLAKNFGFHVNNLPFEWLAKNTPQQLFARHKANGFQIEALLFGQAGMLEDNFTDEYPNALKKEYGFLKNKYKLKPLDLHLWKFLRMRPVNFPTIRLAQFAHLVYRSSHLFSTILDGKDTQNIHELFHAEVSSYWKDHYLFDKPSPVSEKKLGEQSVDAILINTVGPFLFLYGKNKNLENYVSKALSLLEDTPAENNAVIQRFKDKGLKVRSALHSQGLLQMKEGYCEKKACLNCSIGMKILNQSS